MHWRLSVSGSSMPLVWAHAKYLKMKRSIRDGQVFDMPPQTVKRYLEEKTTSPFAIWRFNQKICSMLAGKTLCIEVLSACMVRWTSDGWRTYENVKTRDTGVGMYLAELPAKDLPSGTALEFTFLWTNSDIWENVNFCVNVM